MHFSGAGRVDSALSGTPARVASVYLRWVDYWDEMMLKPSLYVSTALWLPMTSEVRFEASPVPVTTAVPQRQFRISPRASLDVSGRKVAPFLKSEHSFSQHTFLQVTLWEAEGDF